ncbi:MAG: hypothetical protein JWQ35_1006 [Bacteriovoracaceae bacterium]|nr:hypothetical protein [Bacteriovoracaceae bacterium]
MVLEHSNYRSFLKSTLVEKQDKNPAYSMRSFAILLGLTQSALSQVFSGKKNLSLESANRISNKLGLHENEIEYFRTLVQIETTRDIDLKRSLLTRAQALNPKRDLQDLSVELFSVISDWYHLAIKNMLDLDHFEFTPTNIARRLGISKIEVELAIERLIRLEMIEVDSAHKGKYRKVKDHTIVRSAVPNEALRKFHRQMLQKAIESLETQTPREKMIGSETFAISEEVLPKATEIAEEFFKKMAALSCKSKKRTQVYHLSVQFFNLTKGKS